MDPFYKERVPRGSPASQKAASNFLSYNKVSYAEKDPFYKERVLEAKARGQEDHPPVRKQQAAFPLITKVCWYVIRTKVPPDSLEFFSYRRLVNLSCCYQITSL